MKKDEFVAFRVDKTQKKEANKLLQIIKRRERYSYGEILLRALRLQNLMR